MQPPVGPAGSEIEYAARTRPRNYFKTSSGALLAIVLGVPLLVFLAVFGCQSYCANRYASLRPGMTRAQVDKQLWAFRSHKNAAYRGFNTSDLVVRYELLIPDKVFAIQVIYDSKGIALAAEPLFED